MSLITGFALFGPALAATLGTTLGTKLIGATPTIAKNLATWVTNSLLKVKPVTVTDLGSSPQAALPSSVKGGPLAVVNKGLSAFGNAVRSIGNYLKGVGPRFIGFFKGFLGKLSIFGAVITSVISLFQGKDLARSLAEGAGPLLGAALGAALIPFLGPIGPMIGAAIGGTIGTGEVIVRPLEEAFRAIGSTLGPMMESLGASLQSVVNIVGSVVMGVVGAFVPLEGEIDDATAMIIAIKVALTPVVAAFQLVEQVVNLLAIGLKGLELAVLYARRGLAQLNPFGSEEKKKRLEQEIGLREQELDAANGRVISAFKRHQEWYETRPAGQKPKTTPTPIPANLPKTSGLTPTAGEMDWYRQQMKQAAAPKPSVNKPMSGLQPTSQDMAWYAEMMRKQKAAAVPANAPAAPAKEIQQTATNTQQLNQKAVTQITHAAGIKSEAAGTKKNTATANTTLGNIRAGIIAISNKLSGIQSALLGDLNNIQAGVNKISSLLASGKLKVDMGIPGGPLGGGSGGPAIFGNMASSFGLTMTSGYRPGDDGYHGINRARDYSNGSGPTPQMMAFAQYLASTYGRSLKELIYTPLGYSIKDGQKVPPYAQSSHYNHVHVAYALGAGNPAFFNDQKDAVAWEKKFLGKGIDSITTNTAELAQVRYGQGPKTPGGGQANWMQILEEDYLKNINKPVSPGRPRNSGRGGLDWWEGPSTSYVPPGSLQPESSRSSLASAPINITAPISITQQPGQSADELASIVALKIGEAVADARAASIFV
jgi:hypothetical protein